MGRLTTRLNAHTRIGVDTAIFIYHLEQHPRYGMLTQELLSGVESGRWTAVASTVMLMEVTVRPWQLERPDAARAYEDTLTRFPNLLVADVTRQVARRTAQLRAQYQLRPADALHVATALAYNATAFVTNDRDLARLDMLEVVLLSDLVE